MQTLAKTQLHERHVAAGARMVPFAGWDMPVQYEGVIPEHRAVRADCGVFDVSHMGELEVEGPRAQELLQSLLSNDLDRVDVGGAQYTLLTNERGGIVDDLIVYRLERCRYLLVVNASNRSTDYTWVKEREIRGTEVSDRSEECALLAVQGPRAIDRLGLPPAKPFTWAMGEIDGLEVMVNRTGYTGEDGCELLLEPDAAPAVWDALLERGVMPVGLGARDTLRLEVCFHLYGNDLSEDRNPIEAGLGWACKLDTGFIGADTLRDFEPTEKIVPFALTDKGVPRQGNGVLIDGEAVGEVTSGTMSPCLDQGIGMAYVPLAAAEPGTPIEIDIRGRVRAAEVRKRPLYAKES